MHDALVTLTRESPTIARVTVTNPPANLIVGALVTQLSGIVEELIVDESLKVLVFDSGVDDFFYNHFDLSRLNEFPGADPVTGRSGWTELVLALTRAPFITVAVIRGRTRGGGNELALALDLRYASVEKAVFGQPEVGTAIVPGGGGTERLPRLIGRDRALEVILSSDDYDAVTAERWGWVTRAIPDAELDDHVATIVARLAAFDRTSLASAKAMVNRATLPPDDDLVEAYREFEHSASLPGFRVRVAQTPPMSSEQALAVEYHLGEALGASAQRNRH